MDQEIGGGMAMNQYESLYALQDEVLDIVFSQPWGFYLTGGTALSRYHLHHRYSDDLDFFNHDVASFSDIFRLVLQAIRLKWESAEVEVDARDFKRVKLAEGEKRLKVDFVAERSDRVGLPLELRGHRVDNVRNILSNKLCAILNLDEGRDIADLIFISRERRFTWSTILDDAHKKEAFTTEDILFRLDSFPGELLKTVPFQAEQRVDALMKTLSTIIQDMKNLNENSAASDNAIPLE
jgi:predicted nucleotidyltransferase component of viral defense system